MLRLVALLLATSLLTGCGLAGRLYPVQGPLAQQHPTPIYSFTAVGLYTDGTVTATVQDGEVCTGHLGPVTPDDPTASQMSTDWDGVYGNGFFVANVLGNATFDRAVLMGTKGTSLTVEFYNPSPAQPGPLQQLGIKGIAKDNKGNLYKLVMVGPASPPAPPPGQKPPSEITS
jgi:hypothetical protein